MLRDNLAGLIEPMRPARELNPLALFTEQKKSSDDRPQDALKIPAPKGRNLTLTENAASPFHAEPRHSWEFLTTPKVAASAVECQSVTVKCDLDTVEVRSSSLLVPAISLPDESGRGGRLRGASSLFGPDWRASYVRIEIPAMALLRRK